MNVSELLTELYERVLPKAKAAVDGLDNEMLSYTPAGPNNIGWLVWHLTRVQDDHLADIIGCEQIWVTGGWGGRFGLASDPSNVGWGHSPEDVAMVKPESANDLIQYLEQVDQRTREWLGQLVASDLDKIVDHHQGEPISMGVRLVSVANDSLQHVGQAVYLRGYIDSLSN